MKSVYFFGAGSSKPLGYPLTADIMNSIFYNKNKRLSAKGARIEAALKGVIPGYSVDKSMHTIVDLLSMLDYSLDGGFRLMRSNNDHPEKEIRSTIVNQIIKKWVDISESYDEESELSNYEIIKKWVLQLVNKKTNPVFVSSNYDYELDHMIYNIPRIKYEEVDHGFSWRDPDNGNIHHRKSTPPCSLFKLHGSTNWLQCPSCKHIYINKGQIARFTKEECHCGYKNLIPIMIAPSIVRSNIDVNLHSLWMSTMEALRTAEKWTIIGYSMPQEDINIKSIFLRAYNNRDGKLDITVIQNNKEAEKRYQELFPDCKYISLDGGFVEYCNNELRKSSSKVAVYTRKK